MERGSMEHVIKQLKKVRLDAVLGKKKNYNAACRKRNYYNITSFGQIVLNAFTGTALIPVVFGEGNKIAEIIALILTIIATILAGVQKIQDFEKQAQGNTKVADMYLEIAKTIDLTLSMISDGLLSNEDIEKRAEEHLKNIAEANKLASQFPANDKDFQVARDGIKNGEESYTEEDLGIWE